MDIRTKLNLDMSIRRMHALEVSGMPLEHQLRASVALERKGELERAQEKAGARGDHARVVEFESLIEVMEGELAQLGVVVS